MALEKLLNRTKNWVSRHKAITVGGALGANYACTGHLVLASIVNNWNLIRLDSIGEYLLCFSIIPPIASFAGTYYLLKQDFYTSLPETIAIGAVNTLLWAGIGIGIAKLGKTIYNKLKK